MTPDMIDAMIAAGLTREQMAALIKHELAKAEEKKAAKRAGNAERQRRFKAKNNAGNALPAFSDVTTVTDDADLPPPVSPLGPSPRPLTQNPPLSPTIPAAGASANVLDGEVLPPSPSPEPSPPPRSSRGCRIPPGFPGDSERDWCRTEARMTDDEFDECAAEFRDYWSGVPGQRGVKCDWPATFRNAARKRISGSRSRPSFAAGNQHSNGSRLGAYQRAAAFVRAENDVPQ